MKRIVYVFALLCSNWVNAQITIIASDFPQGGDTTITSIADDFNVDIASTGANSFWDFSDLTAITQRIDTFYDVSEANAFFQLVFNNGLTNPEYQSTFYTPWNDADFSEGTQVGLSIENPVLFTKVASDKIETTGFGIVANGIPIPAASDTIDVQYELPLNYSDILSSNSYTNLDLNPAFDGIYRRYQQRNSVVDGWGQVATPFGTFDALRVRSVIEAQDSVYINFGGFGGQWFELPTPTTIEYTWLANGQKAPVFKVTAQDLGGNETVTNVEFKDKKRDFASVQALTNEIRIYPVPAKNNVNIQSESQIQEYILLSIDGKVLEQEMIHANDCLIDLSRYESGKYILQVQTIQDLITKIIIK